MYLGPLRKMRNLFAALRGGVHPAEIAAGFCLGLFLGLTPLGLHLLLPVIAMLVLRCSTGIAFFSMAISKGLYLALAGVFYHTGFYLLNETAVFDGLIQTLMSLPIIGLMGFNNYLLFGSYIICIAASILLFPLVYLLVHFFRHQIVEWITSPSWMQTFIHSTVGSWIIWLCFGNPVDREDQEDEDSSTGIGWWFGFLRWKVVGGIAVLGVLLGVVVTIGYGLGFTALTSSALSTASGVDVRVEQASFSPFNGRFSISGMAGNDPSAEEKDMFRAEEVVVDLNMYRLLAGKMHVSEVSLNKLRMDVRRNEDGSLNVDAVTGEPEPDAKDPEQEGYREWLEKKGRSVDWIQLIRKYGEAYLEQEPTEEEPAPDEEKPERKPREPGVVDRDGKRVVVFDADASYPYEDRIPLVKIDKIALNDAELGLTDRTTDEQGPGMPSLTNVSGQINHLSSDPSLLKDPVTTSIDGRFDGNENETVAVNGSYHPEQEQSMNLALSGLNLVRLRPLYEQTVPLEVKQGRLTTNVKARVARGIIDAPTALSLAGLVLKKKSEDQQLFGMPADTSTQVLDGINAYAEEQPIAFDFLVDGPVENPQFHWKAQFLAVARKGLKSLGRKSAQKHLDRINGELESMKGEVQDTVKNEIENISKGALESAKSGDTDKLKEQVEESKKSVEDLKDKDLDDLNPFGN